MPLNPSLTEAEQLQQLRSFYARYIPVSDTLWEALLRIRTPLVCGPHQLLHPAETPFNRMLFVHQGALKQVLNQGRQEKIYWFFLEEEWATVYSSFLTGAPSPYELLTVEPCVLSAFEKADIYQLYQRFPEMVDFGKQMAELAFIRMNERTQLFQFMRLRERYRHQLQVRPEYIQRFTNQELASYLGVTPEALSRAKRNL